MHTFSEILDTMNSISVRYEQMKKYEVNQDKLENNTLVQFAEWTVNPSTHSVPHLMDRLHTMLFINGRGKFNASTSDNVLRLLAQNYEESKGICQSQQSTQQFLYSLYTDIALTELKGYTMIEFSWPILRNYGQANYSQEAEILRWDYGNRTERAINSLRKAMESSSRIVWRCDPDEHIPKVTYDEVTRLLQGFLANEVELNRDWSCTSTCSDYNYARSESFNYPHQLQQPECTGIVRNCQFVDSDMTVCQSPSGSSRRYDYIQYDNGRVLGQSKKCERGTTNKVESWHRWIVQKCSYCFCLCDEQGPKSDRYFNLREAIADVEGNKVVTGLRFVKKNRVFHLQIQQGKLMPRGVIDDKTLEWKPVDEYQITDANIVNGVDYHTMNYSSRSMDLDNIMNPNDNSSVVTGLRFRVLGSHLNLMAQISKFDFATGKLLQPKWHLIDDNNRQKLNLDSLDMSTRTNIKSLPLSKHNQYLDFVNSGMDKDAAQTTIPFIDVQDVVSNPPAPLAGIGLYYKSSPGFGGFVAPKTIIYDFAPHVQVSANKS
ncbi:uncharacterized protein LOC117789659 [Drosophila innubila]|uniref:uncharacterized protein LOC117789659 n=1 Tax=Drosophila innubila TaxID=198719 RepID=UPI00148BD194|nr:uncharacterized protein LOC117789659 [Drosophila innubila]